MARNNSSFFAILGILYSGAKSGYDIKKKLENEIGYYFKISNGQIYPALKHLDAMGYATVSVQRNESKPERKVYSLTEMGKAAFREWLSQPVDYQNPGGNELLLKLHFGAIAGTGHSMELIARHAGMNAREQARYSEIETFLNLDAIRTAPEYYSYITLRFGQIVVQAHLDWCREAEEILKKLENVPEEKC